MYKLRIFDRSYREIDFLASWDIDWLLRMGKQLQRDFGAYWRIEVT